MEEIEKRIGRVLEKLEVVRRLSPDTFGAKAHRFVLAPPLRESQLTAFEERHRVALPPDFRAFLSRAGGSGAGPYYGLLPMERWDEGLFGDEEVPDWLARPCLFSPDTPRTDEAYEIAARSTPEPFQGAIAIVDQGCAYYGMLVVSGPHAGRVMYVSLDGGVPYFVENADFLAWYERWLDELSWGHEHHWFGMGMPGDETQLAAASVGQRRLEALEAMHRLPRVTGETSAAIRARLGDADPAVRKAALDLVARFRIAGADSELRAALTDPAAQLRRSALAASIATDTGWIPHARRALDDPAPEVATHALRELTRANALSGPELTALLGSSKEQLVNAALEALATGPSPSAVPALLASTRSGAGPHHLRALLAHVRANVMTTAQRDAAFDLIASRFTAHAPGNVNALAAFVATHPRALELLIEATRHPQDFTRFEAAHVLGESGGAEALPALEILANDPTMPRDDSRSTAWSVGENARRAIAKIRARLI